MNEKTAIYPGSFNPWHQGHEDILQKASKIFDKVIIAQCRNPGKPTPFHIIQLGRIFEIKIEDAYFDGFLTDFIRTSKYPIHAVIRGLRNGYDLQYEQNQQYWYEDLGLQIPVVYFITDRKLGHISSSAIRAVEALK